MKVLVACEESQEVTAAFIALGHDAMSCDIAYPGAKGLPHYQGDVRDLLGEHWDLVIAHPPCTYLTVSNTYMKRGCSLYTAKQAVEYRKEAVDFFMLFTKLAVQKIAIENPIGIMSNLYKKPSQIVQPWMFGHDASKATCFWLTGLPKLEITKVIPPKKYRVVKFASEMPLCPCCEEEAYCVEHEFHFADCDCIGPTQDGIFYKTVNEVIFGSEENIRPTWGNQTPSGQNNVSGKDRAKIRSKTYEGIARAMAEQWGGQA